MIPLLVINDYAAGADVKNWQGLSYLHDSNLYSSSLNLPTMIYQFWVIFLVLLVIFIFCDIKYGLLRDTSQAKPQPYSWGRVQLAWWTIIIFSAFAGIFWKTGDLPDLQYSTIVLLGISAATTTTARMIDVSDQANALVRHQDQRTGSFFLDIVSDQKGVSIHRFQTILFNAVFGIWFITQVLDKLAGCTGGILCGHHHPGHQ